MDWYICKIYFSILKPIIFKSAHKHKSPLYPIEWMIMPIYIILSVERLTLKLEKMFGNEEPNFL